MTTTFNFRTSLLVLAVASFYPVMVGAATSAGVAQFITGDVNVRRSDGQSSPLVKGSHIESGQAIVTGSSGRAQVRFSDGGLVSLQPNTEFKIANYVDQADPKQDLFLVDLLRGSMRALTGLIGKRKKDNYRVSTTTATIGISGSGFTAGYNPDGSLTVTAEKDAIEVCSGGVCVGLIAGESATIRSSTGLPVRTINRASIPAPGPDQEVITVGNQTNADGSSSLITFVYRTFSDTKVLGVATGAQYIEQVPSGDPTTTFFRNNKLLQYIDQSDGIQLRAESGIAKLPENFNSIGKVSDPNFVGWGMWTKAMSSYGGSAEQLDNFHYVAGRPTSQADINAFMSSCSSCVITNR